MLRFRPPPLPRDETGVAAETTAATTGDAIFSVTGVFHLLSRDLARSIVSRLLPLPLVGVLACLSGKAVALVFKLLGTADSARLPTLDTANKGLTIGPALKFRPKSGMDKSHDRWAKNSPGLRPSVSCPAAPSFPVVFASASISWSEGEMPFSSKLCPGEIEKRLSSRKDFSCSSSIFAASAKNKEGTT
jgi:hypothetical protein